MKSGPIKINEGKVREAMAELDIPGVVISIGEFNSQEKAITNYSLGVTDHDSQEQVNLLTSFGAASRI